MKLSKGKIILIVVVIYFAVFAVINVNKEKDINKEILEKVIYVKDGVVDKKNEGKLVLVTGKIDYDNLVTFIELDEGFGSIKINRKVEDYVKYKDRDGKTSYKWEERKEPLSDNDGNFLKEILSTEKISKVSIGEYSLDEKGLELIPTDKYYNDQEQIGELVKSNVSYTRDKWEEDLKEGDIKLTYKYYDLNKYPYMSILAVQKDNSFIPYKVDKKTEIYKVYPGKVNTKEKLEKELKLSEKRTIKGKTLFIIMILGLGIFFIVDNKKK